MRSVRFPGRDDALRRLCEEAPLLCEEARARRALPAAWLLLWLLLALGLYALPPAAESAPARRPAPPPAPLAPLVERVETLGMTVSDMDASVEFYARVLHFEKVSDVEVAGDNYERLQGVFGLRMRVVRMRLGEELIELTQYLAPEGRAYPPDSRSHDRWFQHFAVITPDMDAAYAWLRRHRVRHASTGPQTLPAWNRAAGGIRAFYFKDPDGHVLEVLQFPPGKGAERWHRLGASGRLFLGIDHTAIVVADTGRSLRFYRDALGLEVAGESENYGPEQERLNNVAGARLRITALRARGGGPGIEFLEYLAPRDGRPAPAGKRANDLVHWQTGLVTRDAARAAGLLRRRKYAFISGGLTALDAEALGFRTGFLVEDPDGHVMRLTETVTGDRKRRES